MQSMNLLILLILVASLSIGYHRIACAESNAIRSTTAAVADGSWIAFGSAYAGRVPVVSVRTRQAGQLVGSRWCRWRNNINVRPTEPDEPP